MYRVEKYFPENLYIVRIINCMLKNISMSTVQCIVMEKKAHKVKRLIKHCILTVY